MRLHGEQSFWNGFEKFIIYARGRVWREWIICGGLGVLCVWVKLQVKLANNLTQHNENFWSNLTLGWALLFLQSPVSRVEIIVPPLLPLFILECWRFDKDIVVSISHPVFFVLFPSPHFLGFPLVFCGNPLAPLIIVLPSLSALSDFPAFHLP